MASAPDPRGCGMHPVGFALACLVGAALWVGSFKIMTALCAWAGGVQ